MNALRSIDAREVWARILDTAELALLDVRDAPAYAAGHILHAAHLPLARLELLAARALPRRSLPIVVCDGGEGESARAAERLGALGYRGVRMLAGGVQAWAERGGVLFSGTNVPSKAFGEHIEQAEGTPSLSAEELHALVESGADLLILDSRPFDEYHVHSIPGGICVPGAELAYRVHDLLRSSGSSDTRVVVNCAGRTRSIIGAQSLINAGIPNVVSLRNGTMGWRLAGLALDFNAKARYPALSAAGREQAQRAAARVADRFGVRYLAPAAFEGWRRESDERSLYVFDVRSSEEYESGHLPGSRCAPGGQLVQETDTFAPVLGARVVLVDNDGVRATMTAAWLNQMGGREVAVLENALETAPLEQGPEPREVLGLAEARYRAIDAARLCEALRDGSAQVVDLASSLTYRRGHIAGAVHCSRSRLDRAAAALPGRGSLVLTSEDGILARLAASELEALTERAVCVLEGGTAAWRAAGYPLEAGGAANADEPEDRLLKPYQREAGVEQAMRDYLRWELGLVQEIARDGTAHWLR